MSSAFILFRIDFRKSVHNFIRRFYLSFLNVQILRRKSIACLPFCCDFSVVCFELPAIFVFVLIPCNLYTK